MDQDADLRHDRGRPLPLAARYALTLMLTGFTTLVAVLFDRLTQASNLSLMFVLPVVIAALSFGWGPSLMAAALGALAFNFFLLTPRYTLHIADPANVWAFVLLLAVAALVSAVAAQAQQKTQEAWRSGDQSLALRGLARALVGAHDRAAIAQAGAQALHRLFDAPAVILLDSDDAMTASCAGGGEFTEADHEGARWVLASRLPARAGAYPVEAAGYDFWPQLTGQREGVVLGVRFSRAEGRPSGADRLAEIVGGYVCVALDREHFAARALRTQVEIASQRLKGDLLAAVSHDLKTPLSTILFTLQSLQRFDGQHDRAARAELLSLAERETERLGAMVANLLDMGRLEEGAVVVRAAPLHAADLISGAMAQAAQALDSCQVSREGEGEGRLLLADPQLAETALANLLENAAKYAPAMPIKIRVGGDTGEGWIEVEDQGPGFPEPIEPLFGKFIRGVDGDGRAPGTGLGLAIARGFAEAQGGRVEARNRPGGHGAAVRLILPLAEVSL